jgi:hypothetical protein
MIHSMLSLDPRCYSLALIQILPFTLLSLFSQIALLNLMTFLYLSQFEDDSYSQIVYFLFNFRTLCNHFLTKNIVLFPIEVYSNLYVFNIMIQIFEKMFPV